FGESLSISGSEPPTHPLRIKENCHPAIVIEYGRGAAMNAVRRPVPVLVVACLFLAVGIIGAVYHIHDLRQPDGISIEITEILAIVAGAFMLRGSNWARWLALAWMAFHVGLSAFGDRRELVAHALIFAGIAWLLFLPESRRYFGRARSTPE